MTVCRHIRILTVWALLPSGFEQQLGYGDVVGHDGDIQRRQAFAVGGVEVQFISRVLKQQDLHAVQILLLNRLEQELAALDVLREKTQVGGSDTRQKQAAIQQTLLHKATRSALIVCF